MTEPHDEAWHRKNLTETLSLWLATIRGHGGIPGARHTTTDEVADQIVNAAKDLAHGVGPMPPVEVSPGDWRGDEVRVREFVLNCLPNDLVMGSGKRTTYELVRLLVSFLTGRGLDYTTIVERSLEAKLSEPFARNVRNLRVALGYPADGEGAPAWDALLEDIRNAREFMRGGITGDLPPGLTAGIAKLSDACAAVRGTLREALGAEDGGYPDTTLVQFATLVRDRLADMRKRSEHWHLSFRSARALLHDIMTAASAARVSAAEIEELLSERLEHATKDAAAIDDAARGIDPS
jgi:hypothetical protein